MNTKRLERLGGGPDEFFRPGHGGGAHFPGPGDEAGGVGLPTDFPLPSPGKIAAPDQGGIELGLLLTREQAKALEAAAREHNVTVGQLTRSLIRNFLVTRSDLPYPS